MKPSRARYWVVFLAVTLAIITYIDRVCISQAAPFITEDLGLTKTQMGYAFVAFAWAYALFEIPGGWMGDWLGPRKVLMRIVIWWSLFTAFTGYAWNLASLLICRFMFGAGEAGCFPNITKAFTTWLPQPERVRAQGILWMSARWGGAFTPILVVGMFVFFTWRITFVIFGLVGVVWAIFFYRWYRDNPQLHPSVNEAEKALLAESSLTASGHSDVPWGKFLSSGTVWLLWLQYFCISWGWYFYITWLPTYLREARGLELAASALLAGLPLFFGGLGCVFCGFITAPVARFLGSEKLARKSLAAIGCLGAAILLLVSIRISDPFWAMVAMGMASFSNDLVMPPAWGACMDVGGKYAGTLSGSMNMMGNFAGGVAPLAVAFILEATSDWNLTFYVSAAIYAVGAISWLLIDPVKRIDKHS